HNKQFKWILNAWQFYYALGKVFYGAMRRLGQCVVHHLIGRYVLGGKIRLWILRKSTVECALKYIK
ncbi:hypothetical protein L8R87_18790, partial [Vibrio aestuarianus]|nr:hypothetical protein [Vibrio aestuarianus]